MFFLFSIAKNISGYSYLSIIFNHGCCFLIQGPMDVGIRLLNREGISEMIGALLSQEDNSFYQVFSIFFVILILFIKIYKGHVVDYIGESALFVHI